MGTHHLASVFRSKKVNSDDFPQILLDGLYFEGSACAQLHIRSTDGVEFRGFGCSVGRGDDGCV